MENDKERVSSLEEDFERLLDVAEQRGIQTAEEVFVGEYLGRKYEPHPIKNILHLAVYSLCDLKRRSYASVDDFECRLSHHISVINLLRKYVDIKEKDKNGCRPFDILLQQDFFRQHDFSEFHYDIFNKLINKELLDSQFRTERCTYLGKLIKEALWKPVEWSVDKGADTSHNRSVNSSPLAMTMNVIDVTPIPLLCRLIHPSSVNMPLCECGTYPLHSVADLDKTDAQIRLLLRCNTDRDVRNPLGLTPLDIYVQSHRIYSRQMIDELVSSKLGLSVQSAFLLIVAALNHPALANIKCFIREYLNVIPPKHFAYMVNPTRRDTLYHLLVIDKANSRRRINACIHSRRVLNAPSLSFFPQKSTLARFEEAMDFLLACGVRPSNYLYYNTLHFNTSNLQEDESFTKKWNNQESRVFSLKLICVQAIRSSLIPVTEERLKKLTMLPKPLQKMVSLSEAFD